MNAEISPTYIDDVIIPPINEENALPNLREVINTCLEYGIEINLKKCYSVYNSLSIS